MNIDFKTHILKMYDDVEMPGGWKFNHIKTLKLIDLFYTSHYETGEYDELGFFKFFANINKTPCDVAEKFIDLDTKDFIFMPQPSLNVGDPFSNELCVWHMQKDFRIYADRELWGQVIDELRPDLPKYGMAVAKDVKGKVRRVPLHNLRWDPSVRTLRDSTFVAEAYLMTEDEVLSQKWNKLSNFKDVKSRGETPLYLVYEFYLKSKGKYKRFHVTDVFCWKAKDGGLIRSLESMVNVQGDRLPAVVLHEDEVDDIPYYDHYWEKLDGRTLGYGFVEYLMHDQIAINEAENIERQGLYYTSLILLQTRDSAIGGKNVFTSTKNGDILTIDSEITQVPMEQRNLAAFNATRDRWRESVVRKTFSTEIATGGNLPSRTPIGVANLQLSQVSTYFDNKRERFGDFCKTLLYKIVIPSFKNKSSRAHYLTLGSSEKDLESYQQLVAKIFVDKAVADYAEKHGHFPSKGQQELIKEKVLKELQSRKYTNIKIPDYYYDNAEYKLHIEVTGESIETGVRSQILQTAMQILGTNPAILQHPVLRTIFFRFMGLGGVTPQELGIDLSALSNMPALPVAQGGSTAAPATPQMSPMQVTQMQ